MGGRSKSEQKAEGDLNFNNVDYGNGGGSSPLKNLNIGRENNLSGAAFNVKVTDGKAFEVVDRIGRTAIEANTQTTGKALDFGDSTLTKAFQFATQANKQTQEAVAATNQQFTNKFSEFANRQSSSSDQRVQDLAKWGIGAMVALTAWNSYNRRKRA